ncbi:uncharacterized protein LOC124447551 [Xenia sp. Carnegie-2017]|uniref:uncharacterized protein LOC124447551 n=1 Tax=Xenia sp. Carnegie-2017 TaxID=2897299 RepID=UPI001F04E7B3|nr:uncharacterized protein LOC124447551 [Xenia sp. Carnegie-2017]
MMIKKILVLIAFTLTICTHVTHGICCSKIEELLKKKKNAFEVLCATGHNLPRGCCDDIKKGVTSYENAYKSLCVNVTGILQDSSILKGKPKWISHIKKWLSSSLNGKKTVRCYRATVNGWAATTFHKNCDSKGPTLVLLKKGSYVFGAFASQSWGGSSRYIRAPKSFIFSLKNKHGLPPFKSSPTKYPQYAMYTTSSYGPTFGAGHDIYIANNAKSSSSSYTNFGQAYKLPSGYSYGSTKARELLAGSYRFTLDEMEVFYFSS